MVVEEKGFRECVRSAINLGLTDLWIERDNICVIKVLIKEWRILWKINSIIQDTFKDF